MGWNENENRFESNELKWIADFLINNLVFIRSELQVTDADNTASIMEVADYEQTLGIGSRRRLAGIHRNKVRRVDSGIMRTLRVYLTSRLLVFGRR